MVEFALKATGHLYNKDHVLFLYCCHIITIMVYAAVLLLSHLAEIVVIPIPRVPVMAFDISWHCGSIATSTVKKSFIVYIILCIHQ